MCYTSAVLMLSVKLTLVGITGPYVVLCARVFLSNGFDFVSGLKRSFPFLTQSFLLKFIKHTVYSTFKMLYYQLHQFLKITCYPHYQVLSFLTKWKLLHWYRYAASLVSHFVLKCFFTPFKSFHALCIQLIECNVNGCSTELYFMWLK